MIITTIIIDWSKNNMLLLLLIIAIRIAIIRSRTVFVSRIHTESNNSADIALPIIHTSSAMHAGSMMMMMMVLVIVVLNRTRC